MATEHNHGSAASGLGIDVKDPVCGMTVNPRTAKNHAEFEGKPWFFCSARCHDKFVAEPLKYVTPAPAKPAATGVIHTCPMHPQIRQNGPGNCPICGMALEPEVATAESGPSAELIDMTRRFQVGLALSVPVFALEMGGHILNLHDYISGQLSN